MNELAHHCICDEYPDCIMNSILGGSIAEIFRLCGMVHLHQLVENTDEVFCLDNEALSDTCFHTLKLTVSTHAFAFPVN